MNRESDEPSRTRKPPEGPTGEEAPSGVAVLAYLTMIGLACIGGYFLLMKLIDVSRQEDCMLAGRRNCAAPIELPSSR
jgi:hypothetical protein